MLYCTVRGYLCSHQTAQKKMDNSTVDSFTPTVAFFQNENLQKHDPARSLHGTKSRNVGDTLLRSGSSAADSVLRSWAPLISLASLECSVDSQNMRCITFMTSSRSSAGCPVILLLYCTTTTICHRAGCGRSSGHEDTKSTNGAVRDRIKFTYAA